MTEAEVLQWIKDLPVGAAVRQSRWLFGLGETLHFIGLCLMVGGLLIVDLRLLGYIRRIPMRAALAFLPFVIVGFLINLATGIEFFMTDPFMYWPNPAFKLKMFMVLLGGIERARLHRDGAPPRPGARQGRAHESARQVHRRRLARHLALRHPARAAAAGVRGLDELFLEHVRMSCDTEPSSPGLTRRSRSYGTAVPYERDGRVKPGDDGVKRQTEQPAAGQKSGLSAVGRWAFLSEK